MVFAEPWVGTHVANPCHCIFAASVAMLIQAESCSWTTQSVFTLRPDLPWKPEVYHQQRLTSVYRDNKCTALLKPPQLSMVSNTAFKAVQPGGFIKEVYSTDWDEEASWRLWSPVTAFAEETHQHSKKGNNVHATASTEWNAFVSLGPGRRRTQKVCRESCRSPRIHHSSR